MEGRRVNVQKRDGTERNNGMHNQNQRLRWEQRKIGGQKKGQRRTVREIGRVRGGGRETKTGNGGPIGQRRQK